MTAIIRTITLIFAGAALFLGGAARANPWEGLGFTARATALAGACSAADEPLAAVHCNDALLTRTRSMQLALGVSTWYEALKQQGRDGGPFVGYVLALASPLPFRGVLERRLFLGLGATLPQGGVYEVAGYDRRAIDYPLDGARNRRLTAGGALAVRILDNLSLGAGIIFLPNVEGDIAVDLGSEKGTDSTSIKVTYGFAPTVGLLYAPSDRLRLGASLRGGQHMSVTLPVAVDVGGGLAPVKSRIDLPAYFTPLTVSVGLAALLIFEVELTLDAQWVKYSDFEQGSPTVVVYDTAGGTAMRSGAVDPGFHDIAVVRAGLRVPFAEVWEARLGYAFVPSPASAQVGETNLLDADRHVLAVGGGLRFPDARWWAGSFRADLAFQVHLLAGGWTEKGIFIPGNPGFPSVEASGAVYNLALDVGFEL